MLLGLALTQLGFTFMRVSGESMEPTLHDGELVLVVRSAAAGLLAALGAMPPLATVGDVVALSDPQARPASDEPLAAFLWGVRRRFFGPLLAKRVVAGAGETISYRAGVRFLGDEPRPEPWLDEEHAGFASARRVTVPPGHVFVVGDNRLPLASRDSRAFGPVDVSDLRGLIVAQVRSPLSPGGLQWPLAALR